MRLCQVDVCQDNLTMAILLNQNAELIELCQMIPRVVNDLDNFVQIICLGIHLFEKTNHC